MINITRKQAAFVTLAAGTLAASALFTDQPARGDEEAKRPTLTWHITTLAQTDLGRFVHDSYTSTTTDKDGASHIAYRDEGRDLRYATDSTNGCWRHEPVYSSGYPLARESSIALNSEGIPAISFSYRDGNNEKLYYASKLAGAWVVSKIDDSNSTGLENSLAFDSDNFAHISYFGWAGNILRYATNSNNGKWTADTVGSASVAWDRTRIVVDADDKHIVYRTATGALGYARRHLSGAWELTTIVPAGASPSLAKGQDDSLHITFTAPNDDLNYVTDKTGQWVSETIDDGVAAGRDHSIAVDASKQIHISYYDAYAQRLMYATQIAAGTWLTSTIDSSTNPDNAVGRSNAIAVSPTDGSLNVSYRTEMTSSATLKFATTSKRRCQPPTDTPTVTSTATRTSTFTNTPIPPTETRTPTLTRTNTHTRTATNTPPPTQTPGGPSATPTESPTNTPTDTPTHTNTPTFTTTRIPTTQTRTRTYTPTVRATNTSIVDTPTPTPSSCPMNFSDVTPTDYFYATVRYLYCAGIVSGYAGNTFRPYNTTTRGQLCKIIVLAEGWDIDLTGAPHFTDVAPDNTFYPYIETAYNHEVISGYADGTFRPGNEVTRGQTCKVVVLAEGWLLNCQASPHFSDVPQSDPFYCYIETAYAHGIISGYADGTFRPGNNVTRGQLCKIVADSLFPKKVFGMDWAPYNDGDPEQGRQLTELQIRERLSIIRYNTDWVRTYGSTHGLERVGHVAHEYGLRAAIGAWLSRDLIANAEEINNLIQIGQARQAEMLIVGSETLLRDDLTEAQLISYINQVRQAVPNVPVTTGETYSQLLLHPNIISAVDIVFANYYPFWEGVAIENALPTLIAQHNQLQAAAGPKEVWVSETGYPSRGQTVGNAVPSLQNAAFYFNAVQTWARSNNQKVFVHEATDQPWKVRIEKECGGAWGIYDQHGVMKTGMQQIFDR